MHKMSDKPTLKFSWWSFFQNHRDSNRI